VGGIIELRGSDMLMQTALKAVARILEIAPVCVKPLVVRSDSYYTIRGMVLCLQLVWILIRTLDSAVTRWWKRWAKKGWVTTAGQPVRNRGVIEYILSMVRVRKLQGQSFRMEKVYAREGDRGHGAARALARAARSLPEIPDREWERLTRDQDQAARLISSGSASGAA